jgi:predicted O-methyltransferase YrrM
MATAWPWRLLARMGLWGRILLSPREGIDVEPESPHVDPGQEARRVIDELSSSVWAFAALTAALEAGLLELLAEPQQLGATSARSGLDPSLAEGILDVLMALGFVRRDGQVVVAGPGLAPLLGSEAKEVLVAQLRSVDLQSRQLIDGARQGGLGLGWQHTDPMLLEAQGRSGKGAIPAMVQAIRQIPELAARLGQPSARFLDVGVGVGVIAIELCRAFPALRVVGLEPGAAPLAQARRNVAAAQLADRIELRQQGVEDLQDREAFDLAYVAQVFIPDGVFAAGLARVWRALRPGGWVSMPVISAAGEDLEAALSRLRNILWGGGVRLPEQVAEQTRAVGFTGVQVSPFLGGTFRAILAQRPA